MNRPPTPAGLMFACEVLVFDVRAENVSGLTDIDCCDRFVGNYDRRGNHVPNGDDAKAAENDPENSWKRDGSDF